MKQILIIFSFCFFAISSLLSQNQEDSKRLFLQELIIAGQELSDCEYSSKVASHVSSTSGVRHSYFQQTYENIPIYNAVGSIHIDKSGNVIHVNNQFLQDVNSRVNTTKPKIDAVKGIELSSQYHKVKFAQKTNAISRKSDASEFGEYQNDLLSDELILAQLAFFPKNDKSIVLVWRIEIQDKSGENWWINFVDAESGEVLHVDNYIVSCDFGHRCSTNHTTQHTEYSRFEQKALVGGCEDSTYLVFPMPYSDPHEVDTTRVSSPWDTAGSPFGWHDTDGAVGPEYTITRGNNTHAYEDKDGSNGNNPGNSPDGGTDLCFVFEIDTNYSSGNTSEDGAITNLFYWTNVIHDVYYMYGFTEDAGNFQVNNYGNGGSDGDDVRAEAQDGGGSCNANFGTPTDGNRPRMQMYTCGGRDGDLDNVVIVHEYGHGISNRLTGGRNNTSCLGNSEQMGEGWSDWLGIVLTIKDDDVATDPRPVGNWLFENGPNGPGIRPDPYSTDMNINDQTYDDIKSESVPHGVGSVWCTMLWELTWALIDEYGFDEDFYRGSGGNNIAMKLVLEGMKLQPCNPGFVDGRDAILLADEMLYDGANFCLIWNAFAKRGLGLSADQGSSGSRSDGTEAFDVPASAIVFEKMVDKTTAFPGDTLTYTLTYISSAVCNSNLFNVILSDTVPENTSYIAGSASNGGSLSGSLVSYPAVDTVKAFDTLVRTFSVVVDSDLEINETLDEDVEAGGSLWITSSTNNNINFKIVTNRFHSENSSWFAVDTSPSVDQYLQLDDTIVVDSGMIISFWHFYSTELNWDGGLVEYSTNYGVSWEDMGDLMIKNGYNSRIDNNVNTPAFAGSSGDFIQTVIDLNSLDEEEIFLRFWMSCDNFVEGEGWYIDNIKIGQFVDIYNIAYAANDSLATIQTDEVVTEILEPNCQDILNLMGVIDAGTYHAATKIFSSGDIENFSNVVYKAGNEIELEPGFSTGDDAIFTAIIEECLNQFIEELESKE